MIKIQLNAVVVRLKETNLSIVQNPECIVEVWLLFVGVADCFCSEGVELRLQNVIQKS